MNTPHNITSNLPASSFKLVELCLRESIFRSNPQQGQELKLELNVNISFSETENIINVLLKVILSTERPDVFHLEASMHGKFEMQGKPTTIAVDEFSNINAASIMFPYIREHISSLTSKAGINTIILPTINFIQLYHESKGQN